MSSPSHAEEEKAAAGALPVQECERLREPWAGAPRPEPVPLEGRYVRLEALDADRHADALFEASVAPGAEARFRFLSQFEPGSKKELASWIRAVAPGREQVWWAIVDKRSGRAEGRLSLMRIDPGHGVCEIGGLMFGPRLVRSREASEAVFLLADHVLSTLRYRRLEWKCNALHEGSRRAALRFGFQFEGLFRKHMVIKGLSRDTAWFASTEDDWPALKQGFLRWLSPDNFDAEGKQLSKLTFVR